MAVTNADILQQFVNYVNQDSANPFVLTLNGNVLGIEQDGSGSTYFYTLEEGAHILTIKDNQVMG